MAAGATKTALTLRGVEGVAIQYAKCCRPVPGDAIIGQFRKGQGLIVHSRDCATLRKQRFDGGELVDVEWAPDVQGVFDSGVRVLVADRRGLLAELATSIGDADANIDTVSMERADGGGDVAMFFGVQVRDRRHLANVMRALRRIPDVHRVQRILEKGLESDSQPQPVVGQQALLELKFLRPPDHFVSGGDHADRN